MICKRHTFSALNSLRPFLQSGVQVLGASGQAERTLDFGKNQSKTASTLSTKKKQVFFADIGSFLYFCKKYTNLCHHVAYP